MEPHSIVLVSLHTPKEKIWGELMTLQVAGVTVRGKLRNQVRIHWSVCLFIPNDPWYLCTP